MVGLIVLVNLAALVTVLLPVDAATLIAVVNLALLLAFWKGSIANCFRIKQKQKINANPPVVGKKHSTQTVRKFDPQSVRPLQWANEFPGEQLVESASKLFCRACRENVAVKRSVVQNHI